MYSDEYHPKTVEWVGHVFWCTRFYWL